MISQFNAVAEGNDVNATFTCTQEKNGKALSAVWKGTGSNDEHIASSSLLVYTFSGDEVNGTFELSKLVSLPPSLSLSPLQSTQNKKGDLKLYIHVGECAPVFCCRMNLTRILSMAGEIPEAEVVFLVS